MTQQGGDIGLFVANGDINAGSGPKTYVSSPSVSEICTPAAFATPIRKVWSPAPASPALVTLLGQDPTKSNVTLVRAARHHRSRLGGHPRQRHHAGGAGRAQCLQHPVDRRGDGPRLHAAAQHRRSPRSPTTRRPPRQQARAADAEPRPTTSPPSSSSRCWVTAAAAATTPRRTAATTSAGASNNSSRFPWRHQRNRPQPQRPCPSGGQRSRSSGAADAGASHRRGRYRREPDRRRSAL